MVHLAPSGVRARFLQKTRLTYIVLMVTGLFVLGAFGVLFFHQSLQSPRLKGTRPQVTLTFEINGLVREGPVIYVSPDDSLIPRVNVVHKDSNSPEVHVFARGSRLIPNTPFTYPPFAGTHFHDRVVAVAKNRTGQVGFSRVDVLVVKADEIPVVSVVEELKVQRHRDGEIGEVHVTLLVASSQFDLRKVHSSVITLYFVSPEGARSASLVSNGVFIAGAQEIGLPDSDVTSTEMSYSPEGFARLRLHGDYTNRDLKWPPEFYKVSGEMRDPTTGEVEERFSTERMPLLVDPDPVWVLEHMGVLNQSNLSESDVPDNWAR